MAITANESKTGTQNSQYDLISTLYHALDGAATYERYIQDANGDSDSELASFFEKVKSQNCDIAEQAKGLLKSRM